MKSSIGRLTDQALAAKLWGDPSYIFRNTASLAVLNSSNRSTDSLGIWLEKS